LNTHNGPLSGPPQVPRVRVEPLGVEIEVRPGETLIEAAWRLGYHWPTSCYGQAQCTLCNVTVVEGDEHLSEIGEEEANALWDLLSGRGARDVSRRRLACRAEVHGPVTVEKPGVRREDGPENARDTK
jgi:ferredoxin, 2Fe-2S